MLEFSLMRRDVAVFKARMDEESGRVVEIASFEDLDAAPLALWSERVMEMRGPDFAAMLDKWIRRRSIPAGRPNVEAALADLAIASPAMLALRSRGLNLSDQFWLKPTGSAETWASVGLFENRFDDALGRAIAGRAEMPRNPVPSPSASTDGMLPKWWRIEEDGARTLCKGSGPLGQEPFNEAAATVLHRALLQPGEFVEYRLEADEAGAFSTCPCFVDDGHSFVPAREVFASLLSNDGSAGKGGYLDACEALGIDRDAAELRVDETIVCDFLIGNVDRHMGNFGVLMDSETGRYAGMAPIFDSGCSLLCHQCEIPEDLSALPAWPFAPRQAWQLALVRDFSWLDGARLRGACGAMLSSLESSAGERIPSARLSVIAAYVRAAAETVELAANMELGGDRWERTAKLSRALSASVRDSLKAE